MHNGCSFSLTENQKKNIINEHKNTTIIKLRLSNKFSYKQQFRLTAQQINRIKKAKASGHDIEINLVKHNYKNKEIFECFS